MRDFWAETAEHLHRIADDIASLAGQDLPEATFTLDIQPHIVDTDEDLKIQTIDAIGQAVMGAPGAIRPMGGGGQHYDVRARRGAIHVAAYHSIRSQAEREKDTEIARLRAELKQARGGDGAE